MLEKLLTARSSKILQLTLNSEKILLDLAANQLKWEHCIYRRRSFQRMRDSEYTIFNRKSEMIGKNVFHNPILSCF